MSIKAVTGLVGAAIAITVQIYPPVTRDNPQSVVEITAPTRVEQVLRRACYDCHSNESRWPWYSSIAPASWLIADDVHEARARMNFSDYPHEASPEVDCFFKIRIEERVANAEMPPLRYRWLHPSAALTREDIALIREWTSSRCVAAGQ